MQLFLMPPVVQSTRGIHEIGKDRVCKNRLSGRTTYHDIHTYREISYRRHYDRARYARPN